MFEKVVCMSVLLLLIHCQGEPSRQWIRDSVARRVKVVNVNTIDKPYRNEVRIKHYSLWRKIHHSYHMFVNHYSKKNVPVDHAFVLHTAMNCRFALWTVQKISNFVNETASCYDKRAQDYHDKETFAKKLDVFTHDVLANVRLFTNIVTYFHEIFSDSSAYMDYDVLKAFVSLDVKIALMSSRNDGFTLSEKETVELLVMEIVELQRFMSVHCEYSTSTEPYITDGFYVRLFFDDHFSDDDNMRHLLSILIHIGLKPDGFLRYCPARQILSESIVKIRDDDELSSMITAVKLDEDSREMEKISIRQIFDEMVTSYDIDVVSWYHDSVLIAVVKLLCHMTMKIPREQWSSDGGLAAITEKIKEVSGKIQENKDVLPQYFVDGFNALKNVTNSGDGGELKSYFDSLRNVHVDDCKIKEEKITEHSFRLLVIIYDHFDEIVCAEKYLKYLRRENDRYYTPGSHYKRTLLANYSGDDEKRHNDESIRPTACDFVVDLYMFGFRAQKVANYGRQDMKRVLKTIFNYCVLLIQHEANNWNLIRTAYNVAAVLKNQRSIFNDEEQSLRLFERILDIVMAELNVYRLKYCRVKVKTDYLLVDAIDLKFKKDTDYFRNSMQTFFETNYGLTISAIESENKLDIFIESTYDVRYFEIDHLYRHFVKTSEIIKLDGDIIQVYWNGRLQSIEEIFADLREMNFDPQNVYALYDVYNKFFLAAVFLEAKRVLVGDDYASLAENLAKLKKELNYDEFADAFPDDLSSFKTRLQTIYRFTEIKDESKAVEVFRKNVSDVAKDFTKSNFVIRNEAERSSKSFWFIIHDFLIWYRITDTHDVLLHKELRTLVREFNEAFRQLKRLKF